jgi:hypothetical protein
MVTPFLLGESGSRCENETRIKKFKRFCGWLLTAGTHGLVVTLGHGI